MNQDLFGVPAQVVAAITAAIAAMVDQPFTITGIQPASGSPGMGRSAWAKAGLLESHMARSAFGSRGR